MNRSVSGMRGGICWLLGSFALAACSSGASHSSRDSIDTSNEPEGGAPIDGGSSIDSVPNDEAPSDAGIVDAADETAISGWTLTWSDEFNGPDGSPVDPTKWAHAVGGSGWGNNELEYYTDATQNAVQQDGMLVITAKPDGASQYSCWYGTCQYTSARLLTKGLFSQLYGRFEVRAKMPIGKGFWPAFWMLGTDIDQVGWPDCGEIDVLETVGTDVTTVYGTVHTPTPLINPQGNYTLPNSAKYSDAFHIFAAEWGPGTVSFYVDDSLYFTVTSGQVFEWVYDQQPMYMLLNLAVGGTWPGSPDSTTVFPQTLDVDWVRVYRLTGT